MTHCHNSQINCRQLQMIEWVPREALSSMKQAPSSNYINQH